MPIEKRYPVRWAIGLIVLALVSSGVTQVRKTAKGYLFRHKFVVGKRIAYSFSTEMTAPNSAQQVHLTGPVTLRVLKVTGSWAQVDSDAGPFNLNGKVVGQYGPQIGAVVEMTNTGKVVGGGDQIQQLAVLFPPGPVRPGQTWSGTTKISVYGTMEPVTSSYSFAGMTKIAGHSAGHLEVSLSGLGKTKVKGSGEIYILVEDGSIWQSTSRFTVELPQITMNAVTKLLRK